MTQDRVPPHSIEAEQAVLGGLMLDNEAWVLVTERVSEQDFYRNDHRLVFRAIATLTEEGKPCDVVTVAEWLERANELDRAGGLPFIAALVEHTPSAANIAAYAEAVRERARGREVLRLCAEAETAVYARQSVAEVVAGLQTQTDRVLAGATTRSYGWGECISEGMDTLAEAEGRRVDGLVGVPTGLTNLDHWLGGLDGPRLVVVAGRPSLGKSALTLQWALHAAHHGYAVGICSLEMSAGELALRSMANRFGVDYALLTRAEERAAVTAGRKLCEHPLKSYRLCVDTDTYAISGVVARIMEWRRKHGIAYAVVDHIGLIECPGHDRRVEQLGEITRTLKKLAKRLDMPIVAVSQLNRSVERERRRPMLSDLRDSGNIEQDADIVLMLHSDVEAEDGHEGPVELDLGLLKNRAGRRGWMKGFRFDGAMQRFMEITTRHGT